MIISSSIIIVSLILDGLLSNFLNFMVLDLSLFTPLFTVMSLFIIYPFFHKREKAKYLVVIALTGFIYDLLYTNLLFFNTILFLIIGGIVIVLYKYLDTNFFMVLIEAILIVTVYQSLVALLFFLLQVVPVTPNDLFYLIKHSLLINIVYMELGHLLIHILPEKYLGLSIN